MHAHACAVWLKMRRELTRSKMDFAVRFVTLGLCLVAVTRSVMLSLCVARTYTNDDNTRHILTGSPGFEEIEPIHPTCDFGSGVAVGAPCVVPEFLYFGIWRKRMSFVQTLDPFVTLVLLTYDSPKRLEVALTSLAGQQSDKAYELIIVDNGCFPGTQAVVEKHASGAFYLPLCDNPGYSRGNNRAVQFASKSASWLLFLNDDVIFHHGFVQSMIEMVDIHPDAGAVGCKVLSEDGKKLNEAGSIIWQDGSCYPYGRNAADPYSPQYSFARPVDYVSGLCLMMPKKDFQEYGGFQSETYNAYYEDTDIAMHITHDLKRKIWLQPNAVLQHYEHGTFKESSLKRMQEGRIIFQNKWSQALLTHNKPKIINRSLLIARDSRRNTPNVLYVDDLLPRLNYGSGYGRAFDNLLMISELDYKVTALGVNEGAYEGTFIDDESKHVLQTHGVEVILPSQRVLKEEGKKRKCKFLKRFLNMRQGFYSTIIVSRPTTMVTCMGVLHKHCFNKECSLIYDAEALWFRRDEKLLSIQNKNLMLSQPTIDSIPHIRRKINAKRQEELALLHQANVTITVSAAEKSYIESLKGFGSPIYVVGHTMEIQAAPTSRDYSQRKGLLFLGGFNGGMYYNGDAILWFLQALFPLLQEKTPNPIPLTIAGREIPDYLKKWLKHYKYKNLVTLIDSPEDMAPIFQRSRMVIIPHQYGAGIQYKASEAMGNGLPMVVSSLTAEGFGFTKNASDAPFGIADDPNNFSECLLSTYLNETKWMTIRDKGFHFIDATHKYEHLKQIWKNILTGTSISVSIPV